MVHIPDNIEPCAACRAPLAPDQRYCLQCGERRGEPRVDFERELGLAPDPAPVPAMAAAVETTRSQRPARLIAAGLAAATIAIGALAGAAIGPSSSPSLAASATPAVLPLAAAAPAPQPAPAPAPGDTSQATRDTSSASDDEVTADTADSAAADAAPEPTTTSTTPDEQDDSDASDPEPAATPSPSADTGVPEVKHVWLITLTGQDASTAFPAKPAADPAPYLAGELANDGTVLTDVVPVAPAAVANGVALLSGQGPTAATTAGCPDYVDVTPADVDATTGFAQGEGCVYPAAVATLPGQLEKAKKTWRAYVEDAGTGCRHPALGAPDPWALPRPGDPLVTARDPFVYFHSIVDKPDCADRVTGLDRLAPDLADAAATPSLSVIVPNACHDARLVPCAEGAPAGSVAADAFLRTVVPQIMGSAAYKDGGLLVIAFDAPAPAPAPDPAATTTPAPASVGALVLGSRVRAGKRITTPSSHYALLRSIEDLFALAHLGHAGDPNVAAFADNVYAPAARSSSTTNDTTTSSTGRST